MNAGSTSVGSAWIETGKLHGGVIYSEEQGGYYGETGAPVTNRSRSRTES